MHLQIIAIQNMIGTVSPIFITEAPCELPLLNNYYEITIPNECFEDDYILAIVFPLDYGYSVILHIACQLIKDTNMYIIKMTS